MGRIGQCWSPRQHALRAAPRPKLSVAAMEMTARAGKAAKTAPRRHFRSAPKSAHKEKWFRHDVLSGKEGKEKINTKINKRKFYRAEVMLARCKRHKTEHFVPVGVAVRHLCATYARLSSLFTFARLRMSSLFCLSPFSKQHQHPIVASIESARRGSLQQFTFPSCRRLAGRQRCACPDQRQRRRRGNLSNLLGAILGELIAWANPRVIRPRRANEYLIDFRTALSDCTRRAPSLSERRR